MAVPNTCCLCGSTIGGLRNIRLTDGYWVCRRCVDRLDAWRPDLTWAGADLAFVQGLNAQLTAEVTAQNDLADLFEQRKAAFQTSRTYDVLAGPIVAVDDAHQLVAFPVDGAAIDLPKLKSVFLAVTELVSAKATDGNQVLVTTNISLLPRLTIEVPKRNTGFGSTSSWLLGGVVGYMVAEARQDSAEEDAWQQAIRIADYINALIHPVVESSADELIKWKQLLDSGGISQAEYDAKKAQLLGLG